VTTSEAETKAPATDKTGSLLDAAAEKLRGSAKWLIGAFGAIGAVLVTGIQFSSLGSADGWDLALGLVGVGLVFGGVALALYSIASILAPRGKTLSELTAAEARADAPTRPDPTVARVDPVIKFFRDNPELLRAFGTVGELKQAFDRDREVYMKVFALWHANPTKANAKLLKQVEGLGKPTEDISSSVLAWANYQTLRVDYRKMLYGQVIPALALIATGLVLFIIKVTGTSSSPASAGLAAAKLHGADLTGAQLAGVNLGKADLTAAKLVHADLSGATLSGATLDQANLTGANLAKANVTGASFTGATWSHTTCPDGTNSDDADASCLAHLTISK
jgi:Pentapeptide repeats (8 copies)